ncbi:hypothetical protein Plav_0253 [Parvibaculum lavamentivorans DS-1]|uniref:Uncharacterized protein n=1 Tax=Parvibaculum lavamentivorans (strain DS-1 / DSM 13023 / NCIMB 13966) TaxID=402881 RepID=A7HPP3_PARL1|nr:hypothetical protein [Parvibaculum lavamentivorans]ABS61876.1 hypothetical protein Plav_0253 [Parvibaculum lavamentivorans DS-1]
MGLGYRAGRSRAEPSLSARGHAVAAQPAASGLTISRRLADWLAGMIVVAVLVQLAICFGDISYYDENGQIELGQCALLLLAVGLFFWAAVKAADRLTAVRLFALSIFALTFLFREAEIEMEGTRFASYLAIAETYRLKYVFLGLLWLSVFAASLKNLRESIVSGWRWLMTAPGKALLAGIAFYLVGDLSEKNIVVAAHDLGVMIEENVESLGTLAIFLSSFLTSRRLS